jgi:hypothetical protein
MYLYTHTHTHTHFRNNNRTSHPYVYDMTIAFPGYSGQAPSAVGGGLLDSFLRFCNGEGPKDVHIRLKRYQLVRGSFFLCGCMCRWVGGMDG